MILTNLTRKKSAEIELEVADTDFARMRGLMFRKKVVPILFIFGYSGTFPIHSHFCPGEFDAVYVSQQGAVTEIFRKIPPGLDRIAPAKAASFLLELPPEITGKLKIKEGDKLQWRGI